MVKTGQEKERAQIVISGLCNIEGKDYICKVIRVKKYHNEGDQVESWSPSCVSRILLNIMSIMGKYFLLVVL